MLEIITGGLGCFELDQESGVGPVRFTKVTRTQAQPNPSNFHTYLCLEGYFDLFNS